MSDLDSNMPINSNNWMDVVNQRYEMATQKEGRLKAASLSINEIVYQFQQNMNKMGEDKLEFVYRIHILSQEKMSYYQTSRFGRIKQFFSMMRNLMFMKTFTSSGQLGLDLTAGFLRKYGKSPQELKIKEIVRELKEAFGNIDPSGIAEANSSIEAKAAQFNAEKDIFQNFEAGGFVNLDVEGLVNVKPEIEEKAARYEIEKIQKEQQELRDWFSSDEFKQYLLDNPGAMSGFLFVLQAKIASGRGMQDAFDILKQVFWPNDDEYQDWAEKDAVVVDPLALKKGNDDHVSSQTVQKGKEAVVPLKKTKEAVVSEQFPEVKKEHESQEINFPTNQQLEQENKPKELNVDEQQVISLMARNEKLISSKLDKLLGSKEEIHNKKVVSESSENDPKEVMLNTLGSEEIWKHATDEEKVWIRALWQVLMKDANVVNWKKISSHDGVHEYELEIEKSLRGDHSAVPVGYVTINKKMKVAFREEGNESSGYKKVVSFPDSGINYKAGKWVPGMALQHISMQLDTDGDPVCKVKAMGKEILMTAQDAFNFWDGVSWV